MTINRKHCYACGERQGSAYEGLMCERCRQRLVRVKHMTDLERRRMRDDAQITLAILAVYDLPPGPVKAALDRISPKVTNSR